MSDITSLLDAPVTLIVVLVAISVLPLLMIIGTSFLKIAVVFSILRNALGIQQVPPNMAIYGLSLILTCFIMAPIMMDVTTAIQKTQQNDALVNIFAPEVAEQIIVPYRDFVKKHAHPKDVLYFTNVSKRIWPEKHQKEISDDSLFVLIPAFTVSQLSEAFKIGLLLYLPFIAIDLIVSNILLAMGMMMVSPMTISLPFKILIFILVGGWQKLISQLLISYI